MNRRGFFSLMAGAAGAALVPWRGAVEPLIVLPPRSGWFPEALRMREVEQYLINTDSLAMRWDVLLTLGDGDHYQLFSHAELNRKDVDLPAVREIIRQGFEDMLTGTPYARAKVATHALKLPGHSIYGAYV